MENVEMSTHHSVTAYKGVFSLYRTAPGERASGTPWLRRWIKPGGHLNVETSRQISTIGIGLPAGAGIIFLLTIASRPAPGPT
jgi:hypothetical protein